MAGPQGHHHVRGDGVGPHADDVAAPARTPSRTSSTQSVAAAEAGAAVIHLHARDPKDGSPTADPAIFRSTSGIRQRRRRRDQHHQRRRHRACRWRTGWRVISRPSPSCARSTSGTFNYGSFPMIDKYRRPLEVRLGGAVPREHPGEPFVSTYADIEHMLTEVGPATGYAVRVRGLRRRPPLHAGLLPRHGPGRAADLPADDHRDVMGGIGARRRAHRRT